MDNALKVEKAVQGSVQLVSILQKQQSLIRLLPTDERTLHRSLITCR